MQTNIYIERFHYPKPNWLRLSCVSWPDGQIRKALRHMKEHGRKAKQTFNR